MSLMGANTSGIEGGQMGQGPGRLVEPSLMEFAVASVCGFMSLPRFLSFYPYLPFLPSLLLLCNRLSYFLTPPF